MAKPYDRQLPENVRRFIVGELATFRTPTEVSNAVKERFGLEVARQRVEYYDPAKLVNHGKLARKWVQLFRRTRERWLAATADVAIANRRYRLEQLQHLYQKALDMGKIGNVPLAKELLEQAAKEAGDLYTNRRKIDLDARSALKALLGLSDAELDQIEADP